MRQVVTCSTCGGRGRIIDDPCPRCEGTGNAVEESRLHVVIPPGIEEGAALRIPGRGMPSPDPTGAPGDAYVVVTSAPDPRFDRRGADLWHRQEIDVTDAVLGTTLRVPTLGRPRSVTVEPGTQPGTTLRLAGEGLPRSGSHDRGDLYVTFALTVAQARTDRERALWEALRAVRQETAAAAATQSSHGRPQRPTSRQRRLRRKRPRSDRGSEEPPEPSVSDGGQRPNPGSP